MAGAAQLSGAVAGAHIQLSFVTTRVRLLITRLVSRLACIMTRVRLVVTLLGSAPLVVDALIAPDAHVVVVARVVAPRPRSLVAPGLRALLALSHQRCERRMHVPRRQGQRHDHAADERRWTHAASSTWASISFYREA
jgi:hypothetical protein